MAADELSEKKEVVIGVRQLLQFLILSPFFLDETDESQCMVVQYFKRCLKL